MVPQAAETVSGWLHHPRSTGNAFQEHLTRGKH